MNEEWERLNEAIAHADIDFVRSWRGDASLLNCRNEEGLSLLFCAITSVTSTYRTEIVEILLRHGPPDTRPYLVNGYSLLHGAAAESDSATLEVVARHFQNIDVRTSIDMAWTPLMEASYAGKIENVRALLRLGANPRLVDLADRDARTIALQNGHRAIADVLESVSGGLKGNDHK